LQVEAAVVNIQQVQELVVAEQVDIDCLFQESFLVETLLQSLDYLCLQEHILLQLEQEAQLEVLQMVFQEDHLFLHQLFLMVAVEVQEEMLALMELVVALVVEQVLTQ
jgi:hypothetical protein